MTAFNYIRQLLLFFSFTVAVCMLVAFRNTDVISVSGLTCEMRKDPFGIDMAAPRFGWKFGAEQKGFLQTAYQVLVATSPDKLKEGTADLWNSGKVISGESVHVAYKGKALTSRLTGFWKVRVWVNNGETPWS